MTSPPPCSRSGTRTFPAAKHLRFLGKAEPLRVLPKDSKYSENTQGLLNLPFLTLAEAIEGSAEPEWLWEGFVAPGALTVYSGPPKVGKSTLLFALFAALKDGTPFVGQATRQAGIALLTEERSVTLAEKAAAFNVDTGSGSWCSLGSSRRRRNGRT